MLQALLNNKLTAQQENLEDLLTCAVFGSWQYAKRVDCLMPLLRLARFADGSYNPLFDEVLSLERLECWRNLTAEETTGSVEPDVLITLRDAAGVRHVVLIEVKLWSPKSSGPSPHADPITDQLAREWCALVALCSSAEAPARPHMIFLTADQIFPTAAINESIVEVKQKAAGLSSQYPMSCAWISWVDVHEAFENHDGFLGDVALACKRLNLAYYRGVTPMVVSAVSWSFDVGLEPFDFFVKPIAVDWQFS